MDGGLKGAEVSNSSTGEKYEKDKFEEMVSIDYIGPYRKHKKDMDDLGAPWTRIREAQRVLLSPLRYEAPADWMRAVVLEVRRLLGGDCGYALTLGPEEQRVIPHRVDPSFVDRTMAYLDECMPARPEEALPLPLRMHALRLKGGTGVYHEQHLVARAEVEQSTYFQEVAAPFGVKHATGMSVVEGNSETAVCVAFGKADAPGFEVEASERLLPLLPAFQAGLRRLRRCHSRRAHLGRLLDECEDAMILLDGGGRELHRTRALCRLLPPAETEAQVLREAKAVARAVVEGAPTPAHGSEQRTLVLPSGRYVLSGTFAGPVVDDPDAVLVTIERDSPFPPTWCLEEAFALTPRQAEVALLVARGHPDAEIASALTISVHTVRRHVSAVRAKLEAGTRTEVAFRLARWSVTQAEDSPG